MVGTVGTLSMAMIALLAWVVVMTLALVAIAIVVFRKWRTREVSFDTGSLSSGASSGDLSDVSCSSSPGAADPEASIGSGGGHNNSGFEPEGGTQL